MSNELSPICLFTYSRLDETKKTIEALKNNYLAKESNLYIFSDGARSESSLYKVQAVRDYLKTISGFKSIQVYESEVNKGLANSIISGVSTIIDQYGKVIVMEDDLISSPNFLNFMNLALKFYCRNEKIFSISGYTHDLRTLKKYENDFYFGYRASSWGWGTWKNRWDNIDWEIKDYESFKKDVFAKKIFKRGGSDLPRMLNGQMKGKIDSWAIRFCYNQYKNDMLTVFPKVSKIKNIGFNQYATHTKNTSRFEVEIDTGNQIDFFFEEKIELNKKLITEFKNKFSIMESLIDKMLNIKNYFLR